MSIRYGRAVLIAVGFFLLYLAIGMILQFLAVPLGNVLPRSAGIHAADLQKLITLPAFFLPVIILHLYPGKFHGSLEWKGGRISGGLAVWIAILVLIPFGAQAAGSFLQTVSYRLLPYPEFYDRLVAALEPTGHWLDYLGAFLLIGITAPICEEWIFRGIILKGMIRSKANPHMAILLQGFLFGVVHGNPWQFSYAWPVGVLLGYIAWYTNFSWATIWIHGITNLIALAVLMQLPGIPEESPPGQFDPPSFLIGGTIALIMGILLFFASMKRPESAFHSSRLQDPNTNRPDDGGEDANQ